MCNDCSGHPIALGAIDNVFGTNRDLPWRPHTRKTVVLVSIAGWLLGDKPVKMLTSSSRSRSN